MTKRIFCLAVCLCALFCLCSCGENDAEAPTSTQAVMQENTTQAVVQNNLITEAATIDSPTQPQTEIKIEETFSETVAPIIPDTPPTAVVPQEETTESVTTSLTVEKTGEMVFSDNSKNRYIEAVATKYGLDASTLVALYTVPENDSNIVLEFDGTKKADGTLLRNKDTLIAIYSIDKNLNSKRASENKALNEYSYGEMKVMFFSTTTYIMPEFEAQL